MKTYSEKLQDPRWQKKRLEVFEKAAWACESCGDTTSTLHVHHLSYEHGKEPWQYCIHDLESLCASCHRKHHEADINNKRSRKYDEITHLEEGDWLREARKIDQDYWRDLIKYGFAV